MRSVPMRERVDAFPEDIIEVGNPSPLHRIGGQEPPTDPVEKVEDFPQPVE